MVSGTVGSTDGVVCGVLGTESAHAQGADPRTWDFLECFLRLVKLHRAQARRAQRAGRDTERVAVQQWLKRFRVNSELGLQSNPEGAGKSFRSAQMDQEHGTPGS